VTGPGPVTWDTLRTLAAEAGISEEFDSYENGLKAALVTALVTYFHKESQYLKDGRFRGQVNEFIAVIVAALTQSSGAEAQRTTDMGALQDIFQSEVKDARRDPPR